MMNTHHKDDQAAAAISDSEVIARILRGEKQLYTLIVRKYNQRLYRVAMSIVNNDTEAEDIMQVTYIHAYESLSKFAFKSSFSTWLTRILINESLLRLKQRRRSVLMTDELLASLLIQQPAEVVKTPVMKTLNSELKAILETAIRQLPEMYRTVFIMRELEGMSIAETRACLDLSGENVKVRLNRAKAMLRKTLGSYYRQEDMLHFHLTRCDRMVERVMHVIETLGAG